MKIIVTGANGVLGQEVVKTAAKFASVIPCTINDIDISQRQQIVKALQDFRPDVVINCAGLVKYRPVTDSQYVRINSLAPHIISEYCDCYNARFVHVSSDCVFSGLDNRAPYNENNLANPIDIYGKSKLAGEVIREPHLTIRGSFIGYGERGLLSWLLRQKDTVIGYDYAFWSGVTAPVFAGVLVKMAFERRWGLLHVYGETISKYELLNKLVDLFKLNLTVQKGPTPDSHRVNRSLSTVTGITPAILKIPTIDIMLKELYEVRSEISSSSPDRPE